MIVGDNYDRRQKIIEMDTFQNCYVKVKKKKKKGGGERDRGWDMGVWELPHQG